MTRFHRLSTVAGFVLLVVLMVLAGGCSGPHVSAGRVVAKQYDDPDDWWVPGIDTPATCNLIGKSEICNPGVHIPGHLQHDGPHWRLRLDDGDHEAWTNVPRGTFLDVKIGEWYDSETGKAR